MQISTTRRNGHIHTYNGNVTVPVRGEKNMVIAAYFDGVNGRDILDPDNEEYVQGYAEGHADRMFVREHAFA